ncbi:hypothetical protein BD560DRAFT_421283 [Blakeslea trispora]|nr:hypothetical protein BD560DRAFT_421283 [Blakeslea trispora]
MLRLPPFPVVNLLPLFHFYNGSQENPDQVPHFFRIFISRPIRKFLDPFPFYIFVLTWAVKKGGRDGARYDEQTPTTANQRQDKTRRNKTRHEKNHLALLWFILHHTTGFACVNTISFFAALRSSVVTSTKEQNDSNIQHTTYSSSNQDI